MSSLQAKAATLAYDHRKPVIEGLDLEIPRGKITSIIGPNGCGKSTMLRAFARLLPPAEGSVLLEGRSIHTLPTRQVATQVGLLSQHANAPEAITVADLCRRGRYPHQHFFQPPSADDQEAVERALALTDMKELRDRPIDEMSGGQRQRAWIAMALAQETPILLLDEPTTYLDLANQQEILTLVQRLNSEDGRTVVMVVQDMNNALQVSEHVVAMRDGRIAGQGPTDVVLTSELLRRVFGITCDVVRHPDTGRPFTVARSRRTSAPRSKTASGSALTTGNLSAGYERRTVLENVNVTIPTGSVTAIVGGNGSGKSTLLKALAQLMPIRGEVTLFGESVARMKRRDFARNVSLLGQGAVAPPGVTVEELVATGRYPHQRWYRQWSRADQQRIDRALRVTECDALRDRAVDTLSGGQRQRAWLARALAQDTAVLLLDEPTTFLDIAHQVEMLDLIRELNREEGRTIVIVVHDLCHACRYADHLIAVQGGTVVAGGSPREIMSEALVHNVFTLDSRIVPDPVTHCPLVVPHGHATRRSRERQTRETEA